MVRWFTPVLFDLLFCALDDCFDDDCLSVNGQFVWSSTSSSFLALNILKPCDNCWHMAVMIAEFESSYFSVSDAIDLSIIDGDTSWIGATIILKINY